MFILLIILYKYNKVELLRNQYLITYNLFYFDTTKQNKKYIYKVFFK